MEALYNLSVMFSAIDRFTGPVRRMAGNLNDFEQQINRATGMIDFGNRMAVSGAMIQGSADQVNNALFGLLRPTVDNQRALGELASVGIENLEAIEEAAVSFAETWSGTTEAQFISSAYDIKSGISSLSDEAVGEFTKMAALTGKATKSTTAEMTSLFATGYGIYKDMYSDMTDMQFGEMFSAGIAASVQSFKTTGSQMSQALTTLGAAATTAQRPFEEQLAVLGMLQATMPGGEAGTKYKAFVQSAAKAGEALGVSFVDGNNQLLGMAGILDRLRSKYGETLDAMEKQEIQKAFGTEEAVALVDLLYGKVGQLRSNVDQLGMSMRDGTAFTESMAAAMNSDLGAGLDVISQNIDILKASIGDELAPLIKLMVPRIKSWAQGFKELADAHPTIVRTTLLLLAIGGAALAIIAPISAIGSGIVMMVGYVMWGLGQIKKGIFWLKNFIPAAFGTLVRWFGVLRLHIIQLLPKILTLAATLKHFALTAAVYARVAIQRIAIGMAALGRAAIRAAVTYLPPLIAAVWSFTSALLANPITWVVLGIIALGAAIYLLWRNWDAVTEFLGNAWDAFMLKVAGAREWFAGIFENIVSLARTYGPMILAVLMPVIGIPMLIAQNWDQIKVIAARIFGNLVELIPQKITEIIAAIKAKGTEFLNSGKALLDAFTDGVKSVINKPVEVVKEGLAKVRRLLPFSDAKEGPLSTLTRSGRAFVETIAGGIKSRSGFLKTVATGVLAGAMLTAPVPAKATGQVTIAPMIEEMPSDIWDFPKPSGGGHPPVTPVLGPIPEIPEVSGQAVINPVLGSMPELPEPDDVNAPIMPSMGKIPKLPEVSGQVKITPVVDDMPDFPKPPPPPPPAPVTPVLGPMPEIPEVSGQAVINPVLGSMPELPELKGKALITPMLNTVPKIPETETQRGSSGSALSPTPRVNFQSYIRETFRERETTHTRDRRPVVIIADGGQKKDDYNDVIDMAYRYLETLGDD